MPYIVYILRSESTARSYIGQTSNLEKRLWEHNIGKNLATRGRGPWTLVYQEEYQSRPEAVRRESYFKSVDGRMELKSMGIL